MVRYDLQHIVIHYSASVIQNITIIELGEQEHLVEELAGWSQHLAAESWQGPMYATG